MHLGSVTNRWALHMGNYDGPAHDSVFNFFIKTRWNQNINIPIFNICSPILNQSLFESSVCIKICCEPNYDHCLVPRTWHGELPFFAVGETTQPFIFNCPHESKHQRTTDTISLCTYLGLFYLIHIRKDTTWSWHCNATPLTIRSEWISQTKAAKLLGVQIDNHMSRNEHVSSVIENSCSAVHGLITLRRHGVRSYLLIKF